MQITRVTAFRQLQPFRDGPYVCSGGRSATGFDSVIVRLDTDAGITGWGELAPLGAFYDPAFAEGARAAVALLAPLLLGLDPTRPAAVLHVMDRHLKGHPYAKSAFDMACWDVLGRHCGLSLTALLGGAAGETVDLYRAVPQDAPARMAAVAAAYVAEGYRRIQVKVGLDPDEDVERLAAVRDAVGTAITLFADANGGWTTFQARRFLGATRAMDFTMEQPCATYDECRDLRGACDRPLVLDESIDSLAALVRARTDGVADGVTLKIARLGGVTRTRLVRDTAAELGLQVTVEDTGGAEIDTAAILHLSLSTPAASRLHTVDFHNWVTVGHGTGIPAAAGGALGMTDAPGLGVAVDEAALGTAFLVAGV